MLESDIIKYLKIFANICFTSSLFIEKHIFSMALIYIVVNLIYYNQFDIKYHTNYTSKALLILFCLCMPIIIIFLHAIFSTYATFTEYTNALTLEMILIFLGIIIICYILAGIQLFPIYREQSKFYNSNMLLYAGIGIATSLCTIPFIIGIFILQYSLILETYAIYKKY